MRSSTIISLILLIQVLGNAQNLEGKLQLVGDFQFLVSKGESDYSVNTPLVQDELKIIEFAFAPRFGFFTNDLLSVGGFLEYSHRSEELLNSAFGDIQNDNIINTNILRLGPFARIHKRINEQFFLYLQTDIKVGFGKVKNDLNTREFLNGDFVLQSDLIEENVLELGLNVRPGILFMVTENFGLEGSLGLLGYNVERFRLADTSLDEPPKNNNQDLGLSFNSRDLRVGLQFYL